MTNDYPRKFDTSELAEDAQKIIADFHERRKIFDKFVSDNQLRIFTCPSCGYPALGERGGYEICSICDWEDDNQDDPKADEIWGGPNSNLSLTESRLQIGKVLNELAKNLKGSINLNPDEVIKILKTRGEEKDTLINLITKPV